MTTKSKCTVGFSLSSILNILYEKQQEYLRTDADMSAVKNRLHKAFFQEAA